MTSRQANSFVKEWQARLGLQNWEVSITVVEPEVLGDNEAETLWDPREALAEIKIKRNVQDFKHTIIHELIHLRIQGHTDPPDKEDILLEVAINKLSAAFVKVLYAQAA
jgi:hypothetical protein